MRGISGVKVVIVVGSLVVISACTSLISHPLSDTGGMPAGAFPYYLNESKFVTTFTVTLGPCMPVADSKNPSLNLKVTASTTQNFDADPREHYYIDYQKMKSFFKSTNLKISTNSDQTLQSANAESSDQTLQVTGAFLQTAASIAGAFFTGHVGAPAAVTQKQNGTYSNLLLKVQKVKPQDTGNVVSACSKEASDAVKALDDAKAALKKAMGADKTKVKPAPAPAPAAAPVPAAVASAAAAASDAAVTAAASAVADATKGVTMTIPITITPNLQDFLSADGKTRQTINSYRVGLLTYIRAKWVRQDLRDGLIDVSFNGSKTLVTERAPGMQGATSTHPDAQTSSASTPVAPDDALLAALRDSEIQNPTDVSIDLFVNGWSFESLTPTALTTNEADGIHGLVVRQPALGLLRACLGVCPPSDKYEMVMPDPTGLNGDLQIPLQVTVPQLGRRWALPLDNGFGQDMSLALTVGADGNVNVLSFQDNSTLGAGLAAIGTAGTTYQTSLANRNTAIAAQNTAAAAVAAYPDAVLKSQVDCVQQQTTLLKADQKPAIGC